MSATVLCTSTVLSSVLPKNTVPTYVRSHRLCSINQPRAGYLRYTPWMSRLRHPNSAPMPAAEENTYAKPPTSNSVCSAIENLQCFRLEPRTLFRHLTNSFGTEYRCNSTSSSGITCTSFPAISITASRRLSPSHLIGYCRMSSTRVGSATCATCSSPVSRFPLMSRLPSPS